jgi:DNA-binding transcriptional MerR regulator
MSYSVKQLANMSGVSVRTLHWYDEIGLLKPAYYSSNGYRYYEEEQLLLLQQILFFRELGFKLHDIQKIVAGTDFNKINALHAHKHHLRESIDHMRQLIETIDQTILHLKGTTKMSDRDLYKGFEEKPADKRLAAYGGTIAEDIIFDSTLKTETLSESDREQIEREANAIYKALANCIDRKLTPRSDEVQPLVKSHCQLAGRVHAMSKDVYLSYAQLYCERREFRQQLDQHHPRLAEFLAEAMRVFAYEKL